MINPQVKKILLSNGITSDEAKLYLLAIFFGLDVSCIPDITIKKVNLAGIVSREFKDGKSHVKWHIPLFEKRKNTAPVVEQPWEWVQEFRDMFKRVNPDRNGVKQTCIQRMKWFFSNYPQYRKEDVLNATKAYLCTVSDAQYCKSAHKFIADGSGQHRSSMLLEWCARLEENKTSNTASSFKKMGD